MVLLDFNEITPYLGEAENLMALGRFREAEVLLRPMYVPGMITGSTWHLGHSSAMAYASCLQHLDGRLDEALEIYVALNPAQEKIAEFYVNYSLALLRASQWVDAKRVCQRGLAHFPDDLDLLGNYTISLKNSGDIEEAHRVAMRRLSMRRDVHSIEEVVAVLTEQRNRLRDYNLPQAISLAETQYSLIKEGLTLNPLYPSLRITEIQFLRFAHAQDKALEACQAVMDEEQIHSTYRQLAFLEMVEEIGQSEHFKNALEMIDKVESEESFTTGFKAGQERLFFTKWQIFADRYMIGIHNESGERIIVSQVVDYFLAKKDEEYPYPVMTARVLEWMGHIGEAEELLRGAISDSKDSRHARKELAFLLRRDGRFREAISEANNLVETAPWRSESYDVLNHVANAASDSRLANDSKKRGDQTFAKEKELFRNLRTLIS